MSILSSQEKDKLIIQCFARFIKRLAFQYLTFDIVISIRNPSVIFLSDIESSTGFLQPLRIIIPCFQIDIIPFQVIYQALNRGAHFRKSIKGKVFLREHFPIGAIDGNSRRFQRFPCLGISHIHLVAIRIMAISDGQRIPLIRILPPFLLPVAIVSYRIGSVRDFRNHVRFLVPHIEVISVADKFERMDRLPD